jgi:polysaccharide biosynthesis protein PslG
MRTPLRTIPLALALVVTALAGCAVNNNQPRGGRIAEIAGFAPGGHFMQMGEQEMIRELDGMDRTGVTWFRVGFIWSGMEPRQGQYNFAKHERLAALAKARGIRIIANVSYTPGWAQPRTCRDMMCPPADPGAYGRFLKKLVQNFSPRGVKHYEIWNEPNQYHWWKPKPSPRGYAALLRAAYPAAKSADRGVTIIAGAFAPTPDARDGRTIRSTTYVRNLYYNGGGNYFDAISIHPYSGSYAPDIKGDWNMITSVAVDIHRTMKSHGHGYKKIWGTEMGYTTSGTKAVSERTQGQYLQQTYLLWSSYPFTAALLTFNYRDMGHDRNPTFATYGIVRRDFSPKASLNIFTQTMQMRQR